MKRQIHNNRSPVSSRPFIFLPSAVQVFALASLLLVGTSYSQDTAPATSALQLKYAARESFAQDDVAKGHKYLTALLDFYRKVYSRGQSIEQKYQWSFRLAEVAHEYLRAGQLADALKILGEAADLELAPREELDDGLASVAGGLHRRLSALDSEERFELLFKWSMPTETRQTVRVLTSITPTQTPPSVFARALGERPRRNSFTLPEVGGVRGFFSTAWILIQSAEEAGRSRRLESEVSKLADQKTPHARFLQTLIKISATSRKDDALIESLRQYGNTGHNDLVIAAACLTHDWLSAVGVDILKLKMEQTFGRSSPLMRPFLRTALATATKNQHPDASANTATSNLQMWVPASSEQLLLNARGARQSKWLSHEDHILHLAGPRNDYLFFKYPLIGEFEFSCEAQIGGRHGTEGCVAYGGLGYQVWGARSKLNVWDANLGIVSSSKCPFVNNQPLATFNKLSLKSSSRGVVLSCKQHPVWTDTSTSQASPWIGLRCFASGMPFFRDIKITGNPVVPREVKMSSGNSLRGWSASYYGEQLPLESVKQEHESAAVLTGSAVPPANATATDWFLEEGVIHGGRNESETAATHQSRLSFLRPLLDNESISYEFLYEPGKTEVHPALGRIAFLIEPGGVRLHWMTDGDREWTGLAEDNAVVEPLSRRGPRPLPLESDKWNRVTVALKRATLTLTLNDAVIYSRKMEPDAERAFGFYHDKRRTEVRVRNVVMRGDWPERFTQEQLARLTEPADGPPSKMDRRFLGQIFDDNHLNGSAIRICRRAKEMRENQRYDFLVDWVLPSDDHNSIRMALDFTPTNPAPPVAEEMPKSGRRVWTGGKLVSPALDLVDLAKQLGRLGELLERVETFDPKSEQQRRARWSMLFLIKAAEADFAEANRHLTRLTTMVIDGKHTSFIDRWPETLAIARATEHAETRAPAREMAAHIVVTQVRKHVVSGSSAWDQHMRAMASRLDYLFEREDNPESGDALQLSNWVAVPRDRTITRGEGFPRADWRMPGPATVANVASHEVDYLFYRTPLRGNFEVECDVNGFGFRNVYLWAAGRWVGQHSSHRAFLLGDFQQYSRINLEPRLHAVDRWMRYRAVVRDGVCTTYFNGREIYQRQLSEHHDPWIAVLSPLDTNGSVRNVRITGNPKIPEQVKLTATKDLPGWLPINQGHQVGPGRKWRSYGELKDGGGIFGMRSGLPGSHWETLLRYHRPMVEDGTIEYEFFYRQGEILVHPALDRLAFMLHPDGVRVHWVTNEQYERTSLAPDNLSDEPGNRRGETVPLRNNDWNRLRLSLRGDVVDLSLNDELIYRRKLEPTNLRTFGLFHYADRTEARVRNVVWRGDWPRELPPVEKQELAGEGIEFLDESRSKLAATFEHDFGKDGLPTEVFGIRGTEREDIEPQPDGLHITRRGDSGYFDTVLSPQFSVHGDFDITVQFENFDAKPVEKNGSCSLFLQTLLGNDTIHSNECILYRRLLWIRTLPQGIVQGSYVTRREDGKRRGRFDPLTVEAPSGRLRLARRGDTAYYLFAENDSTIFRLICQETITTDAIRTGGLRLVTQAHSAAGPSLTKVVWKRLSVRADKLEGVAFLDQEKELAKLDRQRDALPARFDHDFAKDSLTADRFSQWGTMMLDNGKRPRIIGIGDDGWKSSGIAPQIGFLGDFDLRLVFDEIKLAVPKEGSNSAAYLQVGFLDEVQTQLNAVLVRRATGPQEVYAQIKAFDDKEKKWNYQTIRTVPVESVRTIRIARRGKQVSFIYQRAGSDAEVMLAQADVNELPVVAGQTTMLIRTGGAGRQSEMSLKHFSARAEKLDPDPREQLAARLSALAEQLTGDLPSNALQFDGQSQYVSIPSIRYDGSHPITLEAFITPDDFRSVAVGDTQRSGVGLGIPNTGYNMHAWNGKGYSAAQATGSATRFLRVHLAGTFDGETIRVFVNGKLMNTRQHPGNFSGSGFPMTIGASPSPNERGLDYAFDGLIDRVRISKTVRYKEDFAVPNEFAADKATLALYRFREGKGSTLNDSSGNKHHGQLRGARWVTEEAIRARAAAALAEMGQSALPTLAEALAHKNPDVQIQAITALGKIGPDAKAVLPALKRLAEHEDARVRSETSKAVKLIESSPLLDSILNLFKTK